MTRCAWMVLVMAACHFSHATRAQNGTASSSSQVVGEQGIDLQCLLLTPPAFDASREYPVLVTLPPGAQDRAMAQDALDRYWSSEASRRGWIVAAMFVSGADDKGISRIDEVEKLCVEVGKRVKIEGGRFHLAGVSNGGRTAFEAAVRRPELWASLTVLPGVPAPQDSTRLGRLKGMPVTMYVGELDEAWLRQSRTVKEKLDRGGVASALHVLPGQKHVLDVSATILFDAIEAHRPAPPPPPPPEESEEVREARHAVSLVLDDFHDAASKADFDRYFGHLADNAVFLGTDSSERWTLAEFKKYVEPNFRIGKGWTYTMLSREIMLAPGSNVAWFDELLDNSKYGVCRGSGVLVRVPVPGPGSGTKDKTPRKYVWRITQYNLSFTVPNDTAEQVVRLTRPRQHRPQTQKDDARRDDGKK